MNKLGLRVAALLAGCVIVAACSQRATSSLFPYTPSVENGADQGATAQRYRILHSFGAGHDGYHPESGLTIVGDTFYGTTQLGGLHEGGTVYTITSSGEEKTLYSFGRKGDGKAPYGRVIDVNGTLYGTTGYGGDYGYGTVFGITTGGSEKVLHDFGENYNDGALPSEDLVAVGNRLYGETEDGGLERGCFIYQGCGTVYEITTSGTERVLHRFGKGNDGRAPAAGVTDASGTLYGTTIHGGAYGRGTVFSLTTDGKERVLHSFRGKPDGAAPAYASLLEVNGTLYGTTEIGGTHGFGTIYSITKSGSEKVVHSFTGSDGNFPAASLINVNGILYGTTADGGANGDGVLFSITTNGSEKVLHSFGKGRDGSSPAVGLTYGNGRLFGATQSGGTYDDGVVFSFKL